MKKAISIAKDMGIAKGGSKILFMQESGTDNPTKNDGNAVDVSHSYKKIVDVAE